MIDEVRAARSALMEVASGAESLDDIRVAEIDHLGKKGPLAGLKTRLGQLDPDERKLVGQAINEAMSVGTAALAARRAELASAALDARIAAERIDLTEVTVKPTRGHPHLSTQAWERLEDVFIGLGVQVAEGHVAAHAQSAKLYPPALHQALDDVLQRRLVERGFDCRRTRPGPNQALRHAVTELFVPADPEVVAAATA